MIFLMTSSPQRISVDAVELVLNEEQNGSMLV